MTASVSPLPWRPPAIASPPTPPPRHTTSNSCGTVPTSTFARAAQRLQQRRGGERSHVTLAVENRGVLGRARQRSGERLGERACHRYVGFARRRSRRGGLERPSVNRNH